MYFIKLFCVVCPVITIIEMAGIPALYIFVAAERRAVCVVTSSYFGIVLFRAFPACVRVTVTGSLIPANWHTSFIWLFIFCSLNRWLNLKPLSRISLTTG